MLRKLAVGSLAAALMTGAASADTLREALVSTYRTNPTITGQREALRATDANVAIARAAGRPQISATAGINRDLTRSGILDTGGKGPTASVGVDLSYPLLSGGSVSTTTCFPPFTSTKKLSRSMSPLSSKQTSMSNPGCCFALKQALRIA